MNTNPTQSKLVLKPPKPTDKPGLKRKKQKPDHSTPTKISAYFTKLKGSKDSHEIIRAEEKTIVERKYDAANISSATQFEKNHHQLGNQDVYINTDKAKYLSGDYPTEEIILTNNSFRVNEEIILANNSFKINFRLGESAIQDDSDQKMQKGK